VTSIRCESCNGKRTKLGLGCIEKDCDTCIGVGYVKAEEIKVKPKRIRPSRAKKPVVEAVKKLTEDESSV
jgi:hypothetical protein